MSGRDDTWRIHKRTVDIRLNYGNKWRKEERQRERGGRLGQKEEGMGLVEGGSSIVDPLFPSDIMLILLHFFGVFPTRLIYHHVPGSRGRL